MQWSEDTLQKLSACEMCPRKCRANRAGGQKGACGAGLNLKVARAAALFCEEPCVSGKQGSGAVFLSGCPVRCVFCQNAEISFGGKGEELTPDEALAMLRRLAGSGVHNLNFVSPTQYSLQIRDLLSVLKPDIPVIWNTSGYETPATLAAVEPVVDIYLTDFKFDQTGESLCGCPGYYEAALQAVQEMYRQKGTMQFNEDGMAVRGIGVRHLVLPGRTGMTARIFEKLAEFLPADTVVSLMSQYFPAYKAAEMKGLNRKLTQREYDRALNAVECMGFTRGFSQELSSATEAYVPRFDGTGVKEERTGEPN